MNVFIIFLLALSSLSMIIDVKEEDDNDKTE